MQNLKCAKEGDLGDADQHVAGLNSRGMML